jgi:hypothetical protein
LESLAFALALGAAIAALIWVARNQDPSSDPRGDFFNSAMTILRLPECDLASVKASM